ncbi:ABC transporter substrate-binding protein [Microvirga massiliensis]|uniref:ABC transporter substrate-binding protein n=1 Tax=Microvirga massiliensis TaxID=1033741 RepID=UPI00062BE312|nr:extracellular solute-binding protein [Microvirga massiliensis]
MVRPLGALAALAAATLLAGVSFAQAQSGKVTIVTSYSKDVTDPFKKAFEKAHPGTTLEVQNRNTNAGVKYIEETKSNPQTDLFWASAPDAFEVLKGKSLLQKYQPKATGIPEKIGAFPINDRDGTYFGFAASGYGVMWNERYVKANKLPEPKDWSDLAQAPYYDHVAIAAPARSGTTHLTIETILQGEGWDQGWRTIKEMGGNFRQITERSFGVPDAVNSGQVGYGIVIDFFAFSAQASGFPVKFVYPSVTTIVPANVAIVADAPNRAGAEAFIEFLLSPEGQEVLLEPSIRRLPINPAVYAKAPADYPNPFKDPSLGARVKFDVDVSEKRTAVVDALFDQLVTFQLDSLKEATKAVHEAEAALAKKDNAQARTLVKEARDLIAAMPLNETQASSPEIAGAFTGAKEKGARQAELEAQWASFAKERYAQAQAKAEEAMKLAR